MICRAQSVAGGAQRTRDLTVGTLGLDNHAAEVERVLHEFASLLDSHTLLLAKFGEELCVLLCLRVVQRVYDSSLVDVVKIPLCGESLQLVGVADEDEVSQLVSEDAVGSLQCALLCCFREHNALLVALCTSNNVFK